MEVRVPWWYRELHVTGSTSAPPTAAVPPCPSWLPRRHPNAHVLICEQTLDHVLREKGVDRQFAPICERQLVYHDLHESMDLLRGRLSQTAAPPASLV